MNSYITKTAIKTENPNIIGSIPQIEGGGKIVKAFNRIYTDGLCKGLVSYSHKNNEKKISVAYKQSQMDSYTVFEFNISINENNYKFYHIYKDFVPWQPSKKELTNITLRIENIIWRRKSFGYDFYEIKHSDIKNKLKKNFIIPIKDGYKIIFKKGQISSKEEVFIINCS